MKPWNVQEIQTFIHGVRTERLYAALLLSLMGLRPAEVCGLRWEDVDLEAATITIANTRTMMGNRYVVEKDTKSLAGGTGSSFAGTGAGCPQVVQGSPSQGEARPR